MSASRHHDTIVLFRNEWVLGRLEYQRACEALRAAEHAADRPAEEAGSPQYREHAAAELRRARERLDEIRSRLAHQFDAFCGLPSARSSRSE